jgi:hypothetical protein
VGLDLTPEQVKQFAINRLKGAYIQWYAHVKDILKNQKLRPNNANENKLLLAPPALMATRNGR